MLVFYVDFGGTILPVACQGFVEDTTLPDALRLVGVVDVADGIFPNLKVEEIVVQKANISYFLKGSLKELSLEVVEDPPIRLEAVSNRPPPPPI